jgi:hypothetical protein
MFERNGSDCKYVEIFTHRVGGGDNDDDDDNNNNNGFGCGLGLLMKKKILAPAWSRTQGLQTVTSLFTSRDFSTLKRTLIF